jgi:hypothetical protein
MKNKKTQVTRSSIVQHKLELFNALQLQWMFPCESVVEVPKESMVSIFLLLGNSSLTFL